MPDDVTFHKAPAPVQTPGAITFVRSPEQDHVRAHVAGTNGNTLPFFGDNVVFLGNGVSLPNPPALSTMYVSLSNKMIYYVGADGMVMLLPISEGSILAKLYYEEAKDPVSATGTGNNTMLTMTETFDPGIYMIDVVYGWTADSTGSDFIAEVLVDGSPACQLHQQEPQDAAGSVAWTNTNQLHTGIKRFTVDFTDGASHTIEVVFRASGAIPVSMFDTTIFAWNLTELAQ